MTRVVNIRKEPFDVNIMRPSKFGNPFKIGPDGGRVQVIEKYRNWLITQPKLVQEMRLKLKDKVLGCCCKPKPCHGDVIVEIIEN